MANNYKGWGRAFDAPLGPAVSLKEFKEIFDTYVREIGLNEEGNIASHKIVGTIRVRCINPENSKMYNLVGVDVDQLPGCGCWSGITLEIEEVDDD